MYPTFPIKNSKQNQKKQRKTKMQTTLVQVNQWNFNFLKFEFKTQFFIESLQIHVM